MESPATGILVQLLPLTIFSLIYAVLVFVMARKRRINPWPWTIATAIPFIGLFVFGVFFYVTLLSMLDRLNALEAGTTGATFD